MIRIYWTLEAFAKNARQSRLIISPFCAAKIPLFRKSYNFFGKKMTFAKNILLTAGQAKRLKGSLTSLKAESHFSQMFFRYVKERRPFLSLHHDHCRRFFGSMQGDVMNPRIAFRTDGIDIYLIILAHDINGQPLAHIPVLNVCQETLLWKRPPTEGFPAGPVPSVLRASPAGRCPYLPPLP